VITAPTRVGPVGAVELEQYRRDPRRAVGEEHIVCLVCGLVFRQLTNTHIRSHGLTSPEYKRDFGYNRGRPLMCHMLRRLYAERAVRTRLADRIRRRPIVDNPRLRRLPGARPIVLEEYLTRRDIQQRPRGRWSVRDRQGRFSTDQTLSTDQTQRRA
jgi:ROS/MUCR transcriptional regulator protein